VLTQTSLLHTSIERRDTSLQGRVQIPRELKYQKKKKSSRKGEKNLKKKEKLSLRQPDMTTTPHEESLLEYGSICEAHFLQDLEGTAVYLCCTDKEKSLTVIHKTSEQVDHHVKNTAYSGKKYIKCFCF